MIDTMVGLLEVCAKSSFFGTPKKIWVIENYLRYRFKIRVDNEERNA